MADSIGDLGAIDVREDRPHELKPLHDFSNKWMNMRDVGESRIAPIFGTESQIEEREQLSDMDLHSQNSSISWKVIAWSQRDGQTLVFKCSDLDGNNHWRQYSDTVFPVIGTMDLRGQGVIDITPIAVETNTDFQLHFPYCVSLVLVDRSGHRNVLVTERVITVPRPGQMERTRLTSLNAQIGCYFMKDMEYRMNYMIQGLIVQILDRHNDEYPFIGLFGGQSFQSNESQILLNLWPKSPFRHELNYDILPLNRVKSFISTDVFIPRFSYLVSKDSLFVVTEVCGTRLRLASLLKRETFLILEGKQRYSRSYTFPKDGRCELVSAAAFCDGVPYAPKIIIIGEGVNSITVMREGAFETGVPFRSSFLFLHNIFEKPSIIDWQIFQNDFQLFELGIGIRFKHIMHIRDINDWVQYPSEVMGCNILVSLIDTPALEAASGNYVEFWNIFVPIPNTQYFAYIKTTRTLFQVKYRNQLRFVRTNDFLFPDAITDERFTHFQHELNHLEKLYRTMLRNNPIQCRDMWNTIATTFNEQRQHPGYYSQTREYMWRTVNLHVVQDYYH